ncbi:MAG: DNA-binding protein [Candidatus Omnitrophica bacterium 4484_171]|nr:MAG: DNA-binding protein [Candidatus Omnitrophica bacterium 4484_171]
MDKIKHLQEWIKQADYDIETAQVMWESGRYIYCVFMCHLSVEKALKALYVKNLLKNPPKVHNLIYLVQNVNLKLPLPMRDFLENLNEVSIPTRYPAELEKLLKEYGKERTRAIFDKSKEVLEWLKEESKRQ